MLGFYGNVNSLQSGKFRLNSFESNPGNFNKIRSWELSLAYNGSLASGSSSGNIGIASLGKKIGGHYIYGRYTPSLKQEFVFASGEDILTGDSLQILETNLNYSEIFGFGYSYNITGNVSAGLNIRYFNQEIKEDEPVFVYSDSVNYIIPQENTYESNYWRGDVGINWLVNNNLLLKAGTQNLFILEEDALPEEYSGYELRKDKTLLLGAEYMPIIRLGLSLLVESDGNFIAGANSGFALFNGNLNFGLSVFNSENRDGLISGIIPELNYTTDLFAFSVGYLGYTSEISDNTLSTFRENGIESIYSNPYSGNRLFASLNFALSFSNEQLVRFEGIEIKKEIYPALSDEYVNYPFAVGKVINLTGEQVTVKPSSKINLLNDEPVISPNVKVGPYDTAEVNFYTIIEDYDNLPTKSEISQAEFIILSKNNEPDDVVQSPVLVNNINAWDGKVINLRYFVKNNYDFASNYARQILLRERGTLDGTSPTEIFEKVKLLFNNYVKEMIYVSDPRATAERVQFPEETLQLKGGDCDDLSVGFSAILESIGIQTAFVDYKEMSEIRHVNLLINTKLTPAEAQLITNNDKKTVVRTNVTGKNEIWIPLEMTSLTDFDDAWNKGAQLFNQKANSELGLAKGSVEIIDIY